MMLCDRGRPWEGPAYSHCMHWYHGDICCWCDSFEEPLRDLIEVEEHDAAWQQGFTCGNCGSGADECMEPLGAGGF